MRINSIIRLEILQVCGGPVSVPDNLPDHTPLFYLGYDEDEEMCKILESRLQHIALQHQTGRTIQPATLTPGLTVSQCIDMVAPK